MRPLLTLIRWTNLLLIALTQVAVAVALSGFGFDALQNPVFLSLVASTFFIAAGGYVINDYYDTPIDALNKPRKVVVGRFYSHRHTLYIYIATLLLGLGFAWWVGRGFFFVSAGVSALLWLYSYRLKATPGLGNLLVALLMGLSILVVWFPFPQVHPWFLAYYVSFACLTGLIREIVKDLEDQFGDSHHNAMTLPVAIGIQHTKSVILLLFALLILALGLFVYIFWSKGYGVLPIYLIVAVLIPILLLIKPLKQAHLPVHYGKLSRVLKLVMLAGVLSMAWV